MAAAKSNSIRGASALVVHYAQLRLGYCQPQHSCPGNTFRRCRTAKRCERYSSRNNVQQLAFGFSLRLPIHVESDCVGLQFRKGCVFTVKNIVAAMNTRRERACIAALATFAAPSRLTARLLCRIFLAPVNIRVSCAKINPIWPSLLHGR